MEYPYYSVVTFGSPTFGRRRGYYRSVERAIHDALSLGGGSVSCVRVLGCESRAQALKADIGDPLPVVWQS